MRSSQRSPFPKATERFLARHIDPLAREAWAWLAPVAGAPSHAAPWARAAAVPSYGEADLGMDLMRSAASASAAAGTPGRTLLIMVLNAHSQSPPTIIAENDLFQRRLLAAGTLAAVRDSGEGPPLAFLRFTDRIDCLLIDCSRPPFQLPRKQAVGRARRIATDLATAAHADGLVQSQVCLITDCDAVLPDDLFSRQAFALHGAVENSFFPLPFRHDMDTRFPGLPTRLGRLYDLHLHHYRRGIAGISSRYAFTPIGGALAVNLHAYAAVRGFPLLDAAEDFYLTNKLAKILPWADAPGDPIILAPRFSDRVPFGTGNALAKLKSELEGDGATTYHPDCFGLLGRFVDELIRLARTGADAAALPIVPACLQAGLTRQQCSELQPHLEQLAWRERLTAIASMPTVQIESRLHDWFDSLKLLRFVNHCHRRLFAPVPLEGLTLA